jgi:hypothetical protein
MKGDVEEQERDGRLCRFVESSHTYSVDAQRVVSVTQALNEMRFIDFSMVPGDTLRHAQERGTRVHKAIHYYLEKDLYLDEPFLPEEEMGYFESALGHIRAAGAETLHDKSGVPIGVELRFWQWGGNPHAGTLDWVTIDPDGVVTLRDWKSGQPSDVAAPIQTAAYEKGARAWLEAYHPHLRKRIKSKGFRRMAVKLHKNGKPGTVYEYTDYRDHLQWDCVLSNTLYKLRGFCH